MTKRQLIDEIRRDVPFKRLFAAMGFVMRHRHEAAGLGEVLEFSVEDPDEMLSDFMETCSARQLNLLREIALALEGGGILH